MWSGNGCSRTGNVPFWTGELLFGTVDRRLVLRLVGSVLICFLLILLTIGLSIGLLELGIRVSNQPLLRHIFSNNESKLVSGTFRHRAADLINEVSMVPRLVSAYLVVSTAHKPHAERISDTLQPSAVNTSLALLIKGSIGKDRIGTVWAGSPLTNFSLFCPDLGVIAVQSGSYQTVVNDYVNRHRTPNILRDSFIGEYSLVLTVKRQITAWFYNNFQPRAVSPFKLSSGNFGLFSHRVPLHFRDFRLNDHRQQNHVADSSSDNGKPIIVGAGDIRASPQNSQFSEDEKSGDAIVSPKFGGWHWIAFITSMVISIIGFRHGVRRVLSQRK